MEKLTDQRPPPASPRPIKPIIIGALGILLPMAFGLVLRFHVLPEWNRRAGTYYQGQPTLTTADAYYFTRFSRLYLAGQYHAGQPDPYRDIPDKAYNLPRPIPMLSFLAAEIVRSTGWDLYKVAFYMPPLLAVLCVIPIYLCGKNLYGPWVGFLGAVLGVGFQFYVIRTTLGRFDTDCLNLFFPLLAAWFCLKAFTPIPAPPKPIPKGRDARKASSDSISRSGRRKNSPAHTATPPVNIQTTPTPPVSADLNWRSFVFSALAGFFLALFNWWYAHPGFLLPFIGAYALYLFLAGRKANTSQLKPNLIRLIIFILAANPFSLPETVHGIKVFISSHLFQTEESFGFPNVLVSVSESTHLQFVETLRMIHSVPMGLAGLAGLVMLALVARVKLIPLLPILLVGLVTFYGGNRFAIFLAPFLGMGLGFWAEVIHRRIIEKRIASGRLRTALAGVLVILSLAATVSPAAYHFTPEPRFAITIRRGMDELRKRAPDGGAVWTWWDWCYAYEDLAGLDAFTDGGNYRKSFYVAKSLVTTQPAQCRNLILGLANLGDKGVTETAKQNKYDTPEPVIEQMLQGKFNRKPDRPVYLVFSGDMPAKLRWIAYFGTWDFKKKSGQLSNPFLELLPYRMQDEKIYCREAVIDTRTGTANFAEGTARLQTLYTSSDGNTPQPAQTYSKEGYIALLVGRDRFARVYLIHPQAFNSTFVQMYLMKNYPPDLFEKIYDDYPHFLAYRVK